MKTTGVVRRLDSLGRIVIPKELRVNLKIEEKDPLEIFITKDLIILAKYVPNMTCLVTGEVSDDNHIYLNGDLILSETGANELLKEIESFLKG